MAENIALKIWDAIKPLVGKEIRTKMQGCTRMKTMMISTAYNAGTGLVGVKEAFGKEIFLPVSDLISPAALTAGKPVWVMMPDGNASNAIVQMLGDGKVGNHTAAILNAVYPVGAIYLSVNSASPQELFGGTWERLKDQFLLGAGDTYAAGATGGEAAHVLTWDEMPKHNHVERMPVQGYSEWGEMTTTSYTVAIDQSRSNNNYFGPGVKLNAATAGANGVETGNTGGSQAHNNMPPYLAVYMWKRTA